MRYHQMSLSLPAHPSLIPLQTSSRDAVKALTDDGLLYATIDDDHVNVTDPN